MYKNQHSQVRLLYIQQPMFFKGESHKETDIVNFFGAEIERLQGDLQRKIAENNLIKQKLQSESQKKYGRLLSSFDETNSSRARK
jgi:hypothetical protein